MFGLALKVAAVAAIAWRLRKPRRKDVVPREVSEFTRRILDEDENAAQHEDDVDQDNCAAELITAAGGAPTRRINGDTVVRCVRKAAAAARVVFGLPRRTEANMLAVSHKVRQYMSAPVTEGGLGMRPTHVQFYAPLAAALVFIPNRMDIMAQQMLATEVAVERDMEHRTEWRGTRRFDIWRPSTWNGLVTARPFIK
jgi:hypothetical protein